jgi:hypothetical protein
MKIVGGNMSFIAANEVKMVSTPSAAPEPSSHPEVM